MTAPAPPRPNSVASRVLSALLTVLAGVALLILVALAALLVWGNVAGNKVDPTRGGLVPGREAPPIAATGWVNGEPEPTAGRVTVVHGWFLACPFCWQEAPSVAALHREFASQGVTFVALTPDEADALPAIEGFVEKNGLEYPVGYGAIETLAGFEAQYFPAVWVVGKDGRVVWNKAMERRTSLEEAIRAALADNAT